MTVRTRHVFRSIHAESSGPGDPPGPERPSGGEPSLAGQAIATPPADNSPEFAIAETDEERAVVDRLKSRRRGTYVVLALLPYTGFGFHLYYRGDISGRRAAVFTFLLWPFVWAFHGIPSSVYWMFSRDRTWRSFLAARSGLALKACRSAAAERDKRRREQEEHWKGLAAESVGIAKRIQREREERAEREAALVPVYGGKPEFVLMVQQGKVGLGMTRAAVEAAWGAPADTKEEVSVSRHRLQLFFGREVGPRGGVSYRREVELIGDRVTSIKDL